LLKRLHYARQVRYGLPVVPAEPKQPNELKSCCGTHTFSRTAQQLAHESHAPFTVAGG
jgi:hypothetical protein